MLIRGCVSAAEGHPDPIKVNVLRGVAHERKVCVSEIDATLILCGITNRLSSVDSAARSPSEELNVF
jgi:hypothetical protein